MNEVILINYLTLSPVNMLLDSSRPQNRNLDQMASGVEDLSITLLARLVALCAKLVIGRSAVPA